MGPVSLAAASPEALRSEIVRLNTRIVELCLERDHNLIRIGELHHIAEEHKGCASIRTELEALQKKNEHLEQENATLKKRIEQLEAENVNLHRKIDILEAHTEKLETRINELRGSQAQLLAAQTVWCVQYSIAEHVLAGDRNKWDMFRSKVCHAWKKTKGEAAVDKVKLELLADFIHGDPSLEARLDALLVKLAPYEPTYQARAKLLVQQFALLTSERLNSAHPHTDEKGQSFEDPASLAILLRDSNDVDELNEIVIASVHALALLRPKTSLLFNTAKW